MSKKLTPRTRDLLRTIAVWVIALASLVVAYASVVTAMALQHWVASGESAWTAPWLNVITRGPVQ